MRLKLLIFDWDGTLCDSLARIARGLQIAAGEVGLPVPGENEVKEVVGLGLYEALEQLFPGIGTGRIETLRQSYSRHFVELDREPSPFYPTVLETLMHLREQGYLLAVATGKSRRGLDRILAAHDVASLFHDSRCADETASKPHPMMLHQLLDVFRVDPREALMVGDTEFDMAMAREAGLQRVGVSYGAHHRERLEAYGLMACIDQFSELKAHL